MSQPMSCFCIQHHSHECCNEQCCSSSPSQSPQTLTSLSTPNPTQTKLPSIQEFFSFSICHSQLHPSFTYHSSPLSGAISTNELLSRISPPPQLQLSLVQSPPQPQQYQSLVHLHEPLSQFIEQPQFSAQNAPQQQQLISKFENEQLSHSFSTEQIDQLHSQPTGSTPEIWFMFLTQRRVPSEISQPLPTDISFERQIVFCSNVSLQFKFIIFDGRTFDHLHAEQRLSSDSPANEDRLIHLERSRDLLTASYSFTLRSKEMKHLRVVPTFDRGSTTGRRRPSKKYSLVLYARSDEFSDYHTALIWNTQVHHKKYEPRIREHFDSCVIRSQYLKNMWFTSLHQVAAAHLDCTRNWLWKCRGDEVLGSVCLACERLLQCDMQQSLEWLLWSLL